MTALGPITHVTLHCAATPEGRAVTHDLISKWDQERFGQTSYHWVVELDGSMYRTLPDTELGAHVGGHNHGNIGICYIGGVDAHGKAKDTRTDKQRESLGKLVAMYRAKFPGVNVLGHRDWPNVHKDCPSFDVKNSL